MVCISPLTGFRNPQGKVTFKRQEGYVDRSITVSCGRCIGCRIARATEWAERIMHESESHEENSFITLTYDNDHLPKDGSLDISHWQKFAKRLRKNMGQFRFYHCGEYGDKLGRAHLHACIFGHNFHKDSLETRRSQKGHKQWVNPQLTEIWGKGLVTVSTLCPATALYTASYVIKKKTGPQGAQEYAGRKPPYTTMSRRPGIGKAWYDKFKDDLYPDDFCVRNGQKIRVPTYYDRLLEKENPEVFEEIKKARHRKADLFARNPDQRYAKEKILESQTQIRSNPQ